MKSRKGITLVSLVITIILILILAGVSISIFVEDSGLFEKTQIAAEKNRAMQIKEGLKFAEQENFFSYLDSKGKKTKQDVIRELQEQKLLKEEEIEKLKNEDIITIEDIEIDFTMFEDVSFKYLNKKYLITGGQGGYLTIDDDFNTTAYDSDGNVFIVLPSECIIFEPKKLTISGTGDYDGTYIVSKDGHYVTRIDEENNEDYLVCVEEGYCNHNFENSGNWVTYNFDDLENPQINCGTCLAKIPCKTINGVIYAYNVSLDLIWGCVDAYYDPTIEGYCALVWDKTLETVNFETQIDGIDVTRVAGFQDLTDDNVPKVKNATLPERVKDISCAFYGCKELINVSAIPSTVINMRCAFLNCESLAIPPDMSKAINVIDMNSAFFNCYKLSNAPAIPETVKDANGLFENCTSLSGQVLLPCTVEEYRWNNCSVSVEYYHVKNCTGQCGHI